MKRQASAVTAASDWSAADRIGSGTFVTRALSRLLDGGIVRSHRRIHVSFVAIAALLVFSGQAYGAQVLHFKEAFGSAARPAFGSGLAVDQATGDLLVLNLANGTINRFKPDGTPDDFPVLGTNVIEETAGAEPEKLSMPAEAQIAVDNSNTATDGDIYVTLRRSVAIFARSGEYLGQLTRTQGILEPHGVAVGPDGSLYVSYIQAIEKFAPTANPVTEADSVAEFPRESSAYSLMNLSSGVGSTAGSLFAAAPGLLGQALKKMDATSGKLIYDVYQSPSAPPVTTTVDPTSGAVLVSVGKEVIEYDASGNSGAVEVSRLSAVATVTGLAVGPTGLVYVADGSGLEVWDHVPLPTVATGPPTEVTPTTAKLTGSVDSESVPLTGCKFEYGPVGSPGFSSEAPCTPEAADVPVDSMPHSVSAVAVSLHLNTTYRFRLTAENANGATSSATNIFTPGSPAVTEVRALDADQDSVILEAKVNPDGFPTSYFFEWGSTAAYGNRVPLTGGSAGEGLAPVSISTRLDGLSPGQTYHYRLVASSSAGTVKSPDQQAETLDSCGLPEQRCLELVSPREIGPVARPGTTSNEEVPFQAAATPGGLAYSVLNGLPGASKAAIVLYHGVRGPEGWSSTQLSPPILDRNESVGPSNRTAATLALSNDLSCGVAESNQLLPPVDPRSRPVVEAGGANLYRIEPDGFYAAISDLTPENLTEEVPFLGETYRVTGLSNGCTKVVFETHFRYPRAGAKGTTSRQYLYEWDEGQLHSVGFVPGPGGEVAVPAEAGRAGDEGSDFANSLSEDGSKLFFSAAKQNVPGEVLPGEVGETGVFVREDGSTTRDLSLSQTEIPDKGARYQWATPDGSRAFFTANAGLTNEASAEGTDLYEYDLETGELTDLSVSAEEGGAQVEGFLGASTDGSHVYFIAQGQLVPERGRTLAENRAEKTVSIYGEEHGVITYIGPARESELGTAGFTFDSIQRLTSRVSPNGRYLLFQTAEDVTGYDAGGGTEAYLYDAAGGGESTVCISCRLDGKPSVTPHQDLPLGAGQKSTPLHPISSLVVRNGAAAVFFTSSDQLASGAVAGRVNLYEWIHGQVFDLATEPPGLSFVEQEVTHRYIEFAGASSDGTDVYFATPASLNWEVGEERSSVYDARIGGGFPEPAVPAGPCDPVVESSCGGPSASPSSAPTAGTSTFTGPWNTKRKPKHKKHSHKKAKKHKRHKKHKHKKTKTHKGRRRASSDRGAGK